MKGDIVFILMLIISLMYAICGYVKKGFWHYMFSFFTPHSSWKQHSKADSDRYIIANIVSLLSISLFVFCVTDYYKTFPDSNIVNNIVIFVLTPFVGLESRKYICRIIGAVSRERELFSCYNQFIMEGYRFLAVFLFIFSILFLYTHFFAKELWITFAIIMFAGILLFRYIRLFSLFSQSSISFSYFILYLCALEILPLMVVVHTVSKVV